MKINLNERYKEHKILVRDVLDKPEDELIDLCEDHLPVISEKTGIRLSILQSLKGKYQARIYLNFYSKNASLERIHAIVGEGIYDNIIDRCAEFMGINREKIDSLDEETQSQVIGAYDMQFLTEPEEELRNELFQIMTGGEKDG